MPIFAKKNLFLTFFTNYTLFYADSDKRFHFGRKIFRERTLGVGFEAYPRLAPRILINRLSTRNKQNAVRKFLRTVWLGKKDILRQNLPSGENSGHNHSDCGQNITSGVQKLNGSKRVGVPPYQPHGCSMVHSYFIRGSFVVYRRHIRLSSVGFSRLIIKYL